MGFENKTHNGVEYKESTRDLEWKLVYNNDKIIYLDYSAASVGTIDKVYSYPTFRNIMNHIKNNNLDVNSIELYNYDDLKNEIIGKSLLPNDNDLIEFLDTFTFA